MRYVVYLLAVGAMVLAWGGLLVVLAPHPWPPSWEHPIAADLSTPDEGAEQ